jgi:hypothetical protein
MPALNHGSRFLATAVQTPLVALRPTIPTMVDTVWKRLQAVWGKDGEFTVAAAARELGVSYQAARKIKLGGGIDHKNAVAYAKPRNVNPDWLETGEGERVATEAAGAPPPNPDHKFSDNRKLTPAEWEMFQAFTIAATKAEKQTIMERYEMVKRMAEHEYNTVIKAKAGHVKKPAK